MHLWIYMTTLLLLFVYSADTRSNSANRGHSPSRSSSSSMGRSSSSGSLGSRGSSSSWSHGGLSGSRSHGSLSGSHSTSNSHYGTYPRGSSSSNGYHGSSWSQSRGNAQNGHSGGTFSSLLGGSHQNRNNGKSGSLGANTAISNQNHGKHGGDLSSSSKGSGGLGSLIRSNKFKAAIAGAASSYMAHRAGKRMIKNAYTPMMWGGRSYYWGPSYYVAMPNYHMCSVTLATTDPTFGNVFLPDMTRPRQIVWSCMIGETCCGFECCPPIRTTSSFLGWVKALFG